MAIIDNNQNILGSSRRFLISESFPETEYSQFREYCSSSNIAFLDELQLCDYVAFRTKLKADAEFVRKIRIKAESILLSNSTINQNPEVPDAVLYKSESEILRVVNESNDTPWNISLRGAAEMYKDTPLDDLAVPNRVRHRLESAGITTIGKMLLTTPDEFMSIGFLGAHSLGAIKTISEELVHEYINQNLLIQNSPLFSDAAPDGKNQPLSEQTKLDSSNEGFDKHQPLYEFDEATWEIASLVVANLYMDTPLVKLGLSIRVYHSILKAGFDTVGKVLMASENCLLEIKQLGKNSLQEVKLASIKFVKDFIDDNPNWQYEYQNLSSEMLQFAKNTISNTHLKISIEFRTYLESLLSDNSQPGYCSDFSTVEEKYLKRVDQAIEVIGIELCKSAYDNPSGIKTVIQSLQSFVGFQETVQTLQKLYLAIPESRRTKQLLAYIILFNRLQLLQNDDLIKIFSECHTINEIEDNIPFIAEQGNQHQVIKLLKWLSFDIGDYLKPILAETLGEGRKAQILTHRATGVTLEAVSEAFNLTRERIRQIESKAFQVFTNNQDSYPILHIISAELDGETIITSDEIRTIIPDSEMLLYLLRRNPDKQFKYDKYNDCFYLRSTLDLNLVYDFVSDLPKFINESERELLLNQISQSNNIPIKYLLLSFKNLYQQKGTIWYVGKMSRASMYSFVIEKYFPNGLRLYDHDDVSRLRKYIIEVFGDIGGSESDRALWGTIQRICILYDRGIYIHPSRVSIPDDLLHRIEEYFIQSGRTSMIFHELYDKFADELLIRANITNRFSLQGVLKVKFGEKYIFYRDGISTIEGYKITQEIETYIRNHSPVSKETVLATFSGITDAMFSQNVMRIPSVILTENSTFIHSDTLNLIDDDYAIREIIRTYTDNCPVTASKFLEILYSTHSDFLIRNNIYSPNTLFGVLQFMFGDEFSFSRPYISLLTTNNTSKRDIMLALLEGQERVNIADLLSLCEEHHLSFQSPTLMIRAIHDEYLRIDQDTLVSMANIHFTNEELNNIKELLINDIRLKGYLLFKSIDNYYFYPDLGFPWTVFLLRSIIEKHFQSELKIVNNASINNVAFDLIIDPQLEIDNYEDVIRMAIRAEHQRDPFKDQSSVVKWLIDEGLLTKKAANIKNELGLFESTTIQLVERHLPKFITNSGFMYTDEFGTLIIR